MCAQGTHRCVSVQACWPDCWSRMFTVGFSMPSSVLIQWGL